jgi:hypothetical protein
MSSIAIFISAFFYCAATAVASQPVKLPLQDFQKGRRGLLQGRVQPIPKKAVHVALKDGAGKLLFKGAPLKPETIKIKKDPNSDRRLAKEGSIRGGDIIDSVPRERTLHDLKKNSAFMANVVMPVQFQGKLEKTLGGSGRRLQIDLYCDPTDDGSLTCCALDVPFPSTAMCLTCPSDTIETDDISACYECAIFDESGEFCNSCSMSCADTEVSVASWDCSNLSNDECAIVDCDGNCNRYGGGGGGGGGTSGAWNPKSSASMTALFLSATAVGALGLF